MFKDPKRQLYSDKKEVKSFLSFSEHRIKNQNNNNNCNFIISKCLHTGQVTFVYFHVINLSYQSDLLFTGISEI